MFRECFDESTKKWYTYDDEQVFLNKGNVNECPSKTAYVLFYDKNN